MFRKPRDEASGPALTPSIGRPPTPPHDWSPPLQSPTPLRNTTFDRALLPAARQPMAVANGVKKAPDRSKQKSNSTILSFFKKVDKLEESLFIYDSPSQAANLSHASKGSPEATSAYDVAQTSRYNETGSPVKRRRLDPAQLETIEAGRGKTELVLKEEVDQGDHPRKSSGPFLDDSDEEAEVEQEDEKVEREHFGEYKREDEAGEIHNVEGLQEVDTPLHSVQDDLIEKASEEGNRTQDIALTEVPALKREATSLADEDLFGELGDFVDDEFPEDGEEQMERRWIEQQMALEDDFEDDAPPEDPPAMPNGGMIMKDETESAAAACPICSASLAGISTEQASIHVNGCLDGKPVPLPSPKAQEPISTGAPTTSNGVKNPFKDSGGPSHKRFQLAAIPRPAQANPFASASKNGEGGSAFSRLMSSHAEDRAWSAAAANEAASRGKPAGKRTCPFYKILPGMAICVDGFRYGAVQGCVAYFLSHFHSDHYIGLTASWCHGPIYCSRVTGNLVRQQLRVDPKWVVDLDWETPTDVPGTGGVQVTMIPANHCPGSSLFLYEKRLGGGGNGRPPRQQRVLHCGDFRACPAHVRHPLLRPDVVDAVTGRNRQQKLDVCYLDTTYLTPKYAFPSQEAVTKACADMCVSLSKDQVDHSDVWEQTKRARAGKGMVQFVQANGAAAVDPAGEAGDSKSTDQIVDRGRGRLLVVVGTYSIGKERICLGIARALGSKIYATPAKQRICRALEDPELTGLLTSDPRAAQVHMQSLMEIRPETLEEYLASQRPHFARVVGFRPSGWNYRPPSGRMLDNPPVPTVLHSEAWRPRFAMAELVPQRGSTRAASCFGVPYSEHSSFRELSMFCCALRIDKIIPTVNVGSAKSRERMKGWIERWAAEKKKNGLYRVEGEGEGW